MALSSGPHSSRFPIVSSVPNSCRNNFNNNNSRHSNKVVGDKWAEAMTTETPDIEVCPRNRLDKGGRRTVTSSLALESGVGTIRVVVSRLKVWYG